MKKVKFNYGPRNDGFKALIFDLLRIGGISSKKIKNAIFDMASFSQIFTHDSADRDNNYQAFEFLGDGSWNYCVCKYLPRRLGEEYMCMDGVRVLARLKIDLVSKKTLSWGAELLGFWPYITAAVDYRRTKKKTNVRRLF